MNTKPLIGVIIALLFIVGVGYILYAGRPVMQRQSSAASTAPALEQGTPSPTTTPATTTISESTSQPGTYTLTEVQTHNIPTNCWAAVSGNVYDLTTWVSRHPGGENAIKGLCGIDGTERFNRKHGTSNAAKAALTLLKIGTLR